MDAEKMEAEVHQIKLIAQWFPGVVLGLKRQVGKTEAIAQMIHEKHKGRAAYLGASEIMAELFARRYREAYPEDEQPLCGWEPRKWRGQEQRPMYLDEPWFMCPQTRQDAANLNWPIMAEIGTASFHRRGEAE